MAKVVGLVLPFDSDTAVARVFDEASDDISDIVGGMIEIVQLTSQSHMYINEEAKLMNPPLPRNDLAMRLIAASPYSLPPLSYMFRGPLGEGMVDDEGKDFIAGNAVIFGSRNAPNEADYPDEVTQWAMKAGLKMQGGPVRVDGGNPWPLLDVRRQVNLPMDGSARTLPESPVRRAARAERRAADRLRRAGGDPDALEREMLRGGAITGNPYSGRSADSMKLREILADADRVTGGVLGVAPDRKSPFANDLIAEARARVERVAQTGNVSDNRPGHGVEPDGSR